VLILYSKLRKHIASLKDILDSGLHFWLPCIFITRDSMLQYTKFSAALDSLCSLGCKHSCLPSASSLTSTPLFIVYLL